MLALPGQVNETLSGQEFFYLTRSSSSKYTGAGTGSEFLGRARAFSLGTGSGSGFDKLSFRLMYCRPNIDPGATGSGLGPFQLHSSLYIGCLKARRYHDSIYS